MGLFLRTFFFDVSDSFVWEVCICTNINHVGRIRFQVHTKSRLSARSFLFKSKTHLTACMLTHFGSQKFSQLKL